MKENITATMNLSIQKRLTRCFATMALAAGLVSALVTTSLGQITETDSQSTVVASPDSLAANGVTTSTITVTLKDSGGNPVQGKITSLTSSRGALDTISAASGPSSSSGVVTFTVKSLIAGLPEFTATDITDSIVVNQKPTVTFTANPVVASASQSAVAASRSVLVADGNASSTITVALKDSGGAGVGGKTVTLASSRGVTDIISSASGVSDASGVVTFTVRSSTLGSAVLTATDVTDSVVITQTVTVTLVASSTYTTQPLTGDADSGISSSKTYTHAVNLWGGALTINGVNFTDGGLSSTNYALNLTNSGIAGGPSSVGGQVGEMVAGFYYDGAAQPATLVLSNLTANTSYKTVFYNRGWGGAGARFVRIADSHGNSNVFDQNWNGDAKGNLLIIPFTTGPAETSYAFTFTPIAGGSFHFYGFSNEVVPVPASPSAPVYSAVRLYGDTDSGISGSKTYTHAVNICAATNISINDVVFATDAVRTNYGLSIAYQGVFGPTGNNATGNMSLLLGDFYYSGLGVGVETLTLYGLQPNTQYKTVFYHTGWDGAVLYVNIKDSLGGGYANFPMNWAGAGNGDRLNVTYTTGAEDTTITFQFVAVDGNSSYHQYGFSNEILTDETTALPSLTDNFLAAGTPNTSDLNYNLAGRQGGSLATNTYTGSGNAQVGNPTGAIDGGNYLLAAFEATAALNYNFNDSVDAPWTISFDMGPNVGAVGDTTVWAAVDIGNDSAHKNSNFVSGNGVGIAFRGNGMIFVYNNGADITSSGTGLTIWDGGSGSGNHTTDMTPIKVVVSDPAGTGSGFGPNGTMIKLYASGSLIHTYSTSGGGLSAGFLNNYVNFCGSHIAAFDNLKIQHEFNLFSPLGTNWVAAQSYTGNMVIAENATYRWDAGTGAADLVQVSGQVTLPTNMTVTVHLADGRLDNGSLPLFTSGSLAGNTDLRIWTLLGAPTGSKLELSGNSVVLRKYPQGTLIRFL